MNNRQLERAYVFIVEMSGVSVKRMNERLVNSQLMKHNVRSAFEPSIGEAAVVSWLKTMCEGDL